MELLLFHGGIKRDEGNNPRRALSLEGLGKKRILWRDVDRVKPSVNFLAAIRSISRNSGDADAIRVSLHGEIRERNVEQSRAKRLVSRHSPPSTSQRSKWGIKREKKKKKIEERKIEKKLLSSGISC